MNMKNEEQLGFPDLSPDLPQQRTANEDLEDVVNDLVERLTKDRRRL